MLKIIIVTLLYMYLMLKSFCRSCEFKAVRKWKSYIRFLLILCVTISVFTVYSNKCTGTSVLFLFLLSTSPSCSPGLQSLWAETTWWHPSGPWGVRDLHHNRDLVWVFFISIALITDVIIKSCNAALVLTILYDRVKQHHKLRI